MEENITMVETENKQEISTPVEDENGKIVFANDVIATIASLAVVDVDGVHSMGGNVISGLSSMFGKKNYTKGIKIEVAEKTVKIDVSIIVKYGYKVQEVCKEIQAAVKNAVETMTGLNVLEVNTYVQSVEFEKAENTEPVVTEDVIEIEPVDQ